MQHGMRSPSRKTLAEVQDTAGDDAPTQPPGTRDAEQGATLTSSQALKLADSLSLSEQIAELSRCSPSDLISLDVSHSDLEDLSFLSSMIELKELNLTGCRRLTDMSALACCGGLRKLVMWQPATYANAGGADKEQQEELKRRWEIYPRMKVVNSALASLASLQELYLGVSPDQVGTCGWVTSIAFMPKLLQLRLLSLRGCNKLREVQPLAACPALLVADLRDVGYSLDGGGLDCLASCRTLVRLVLGQDEFDSDPADHIAAAVLSKVVLAPTLGFGKLSDAVTMTGTYLSLKDSSSWGVENMLCY